MRYAAVAYRLPLTADSGARKHFIRATQTTQDDDGLRLDRLIVRGRQPYRELLGLDVGVASKDGPPAWTHASQNIVKDLTRIHGERTVVTQIPLKICPC